MILLKYLDSKPLHLDHSLLHSINQRAAQRNLSLPFAFVTPPPAKNNNEKFLSRYLIPQVHRNKRLYDAVKPPPGTPPSLCKCILCCFSASSNEPADQSEQQNDETQQLNQQQQQPTTTMNATPNFASYVPPQAQVSNQGEISINSHHCFWMEDAFWCTMVPQKQHCQEYAFYLQRQTETGGKVRGKPPHSHYCPKACALNARNPLATPFY